MSANVVAICTHNRADRLPRLIESLRLQTCDEPFEILFIDNNSSDSSFEIINHHASEPGIPIRYVLEKKPGISHARNRAIEECKKAQFMLVMDDDELPRPNWVQACISCFRRENADCIGGRVEVFFKPNQRPDWLPDDLLAFLAETNHGDRSFWITDSSTPIWTANIAYKTELFKDGLRFDERYNRKGNAVGGGEDLMMFNELLTRKTKMFYCPDMVVEHHVEPFKLKRLYFLKLHFVSGFKTGLYELEKFPRSLFGVPLFMMRSFAKQCFFTLKILKKPQGDILRQAMNASHALGMIVGCFYRYCLDSKSLSVGGK